MENSPQVINAASPLATVDDIQLTATTPDQMVQSQQSLIAWFEKKIARLKEEAWDLEKEKLIAKRNKWRTAAFDRHHKIALKRVDYYVKIREALLDGYFIVPNFPVDLFALRTTAKNVKPDKINYWSTVHFEQKTSGLPMGEGEYKNPAPLTMQRDYTDANGKQGRWYWAEDWKEMEFPLSMAKPVIMEATERAMALKVFDRFGIMPSTQRNDDPMIIGQITKTEGYRTKIVSFIIAWYLDTKVL